jgi:hypothetical protein
LAGLWIATDVTDEFDVVQCFHGGWVLSAGVVERRAEKVTSFFRDLHRERPEAVGRGRDRGLDRVGQAARTGAVVVRRK